MTEEQEDNFTMQLQAARTKQLLAWLHTAPLLPPSVHKIEMLVTHDDAMQIHLSGECQFIQPKPPKRTYWAFCFLLAFSTAIGFLLGRLL